MKETVSLGDAEKMIRDQWSLVGHNDNVEFHRLTFIEYFLRDNYCINIYGFTLCLLTTSQYSERHNYDNSL